MADIPDVFLLGVTFFVSVGASIISGMAGGGSGFIIAPFFMLIGLPPHLATATAKMNEVGVNASSIVAAKRARRRERQYVTSEGAIVTTHPHNMLRSQAMAVLFGITMINVAFAAWLIPHLQAEGIKYIVGVLLIGMIPTLFINKKSFQPGMRSRRWRRAGYVIYSGVSFMQALFGMGIGMFISMVLMYAFGLPVTEANDIKRRLMMGQSSVLLILLLAQGVVLLPFGVAALLGAVAGAQVGTLIGIKKGNLFIKKVLAGVMLVSGIVLFL